MTSAIAWDMLVETAPTIGGHMIRDGRIHFREGIMEVSDATLYAMRVDYLFVRHEYRGRGIARKWLRWLCKTCEACGCLVFLRPGTFEDGGLGQKELRAWYMSQGFRKHPHRRGYLLYHGDVKWPDEKTMRRTASRGDVGSGWRDAKARILAPSGSRCARSSNGDVSVAESM